LPTINIVNFSAPAVVIPSATSILTLSPGFAPAGAAIATLTGSVGITFVPSFVAKLISA